MNMAQGTAIVPRQRMLHRMITSMKMIPTHIDSAKGCVHQGMDRFGIVSPEHRKNGYVTVNC